MQVSGTEKHHVWPRIMESAQQGVGGGSLGEASEVGGFSFAGLMQQQFATVAGAVVASSADGSTAAASSQTAPICPDQPAVASAEAPDAAASQAAAAVADQAPAAASTASSAGSSQPAEVVAAGVDTSTVAQPSDAANAPGTGLVTADGAPLIVPNAEPSWDARGNTGPATYNPYYGTSTSPNVEGKVTGYDKWFQSVTVGDPGGFTWPPCYSATSDGAQEALRLVQQYVPGASIQAFQHNGQVGSELSYNILLPNGRTMNAGLLLDSYYHQGTGVDATSEGVIQDAIDWPAGTPPPQQ